jgi:hypothetical protein
MGFKRISSVLWHTYFSFLKKEKYQKKNFCAKLAFRLSHSAGKTGGSISGITRNASFAQSSF